MRRLYRANGAAIRARNRARWPKARKRELVRLKARYEADGAEMRAAARARYASDPALRAKTIERATDRQRVLQAVAPHVLREYKRAAHRRQPHKKTAASARRRAAQVDATPWWADRAAIDDIYAMAEMMSRIFGKRYDVDHIVPLRGKTVSGLHVPANLQVICAMENSAKGNKVWPGMSPTTTRSMSRKLDAKLP